jgi:predicted ribosomally synthesized peptide with nif11-like leader
MSKVKEFYEALSKDEAMQERAKGLSVTAETTEEAAAEAALAFAKAEGYAFTAGELKDFSKELSDEELAAVAGGARDNECWFGGSFHFTRMVAGVPIGGDCFCALYGQGDDGKFRCAVVGTYAFDHWISFGHLPDNR